MAEPERDDGPASAAMGRIGVDRKKRIPFVQQLTATDCLASCLTMALHYHGKEVRLEDVRQVVGSDRDGTDALALVNAAHWYGMRARGVALDVDDFELLEPATVLHWNFNHFVLFESIGKQGVTVVDPALGRRIVPAEELRKSFTGVAVLLEPTDDFQPEKSGDRPALRYLLKLAEQRGLWTRILVTSVIAMAFTLAAPILTSAVVDRVVPRQDQDLLTVLSAGMGMLVVFFFLSTWLRAHLLLHLRTILDARMTLGFVDHMVDLPYEFFQRRSAGDLIMRMNSNATVREILTSSALSAVLDGALVTLYLVLLLILSPRLGVLVLAVGAIQVIVYLVTRRRQRDLMSQGLQVQAKAQSYEVELLRGIETLKSMGMEPRAVETWSNYFVDSLNVSLARGRLNALVEAVLGTLGMGAPLLILAYGAMLVVEGNMTLGTMLGLTSLAVGVLLPLGGLVETAYKLQLLGSYLERLDDVLLTPREQQGARVRPAPDLKGRIELLGVSFQYGPLAPPVVRDVSVDIRPGQLVAIVGRSGAGKSTLARLLLGLYWPTQGRILYDGADLRELEIRSVRRQLGIVPQDPYLFGTSVRANIALGDPAAQLAEVQAAGRLAFIHDEIMAMPMGYETPLVDGGTSLAGGQRQRVALARALLRKPSILLLDEATSALDAVTEKQVQTALAGLSCTRIVIAHRLSTVVAADLILVMDEGRLIEQGTHRELLLGAGRYSELVAAQLIGEPPP